MSIIVDNTNQTTTNKIQNLTDKLTEIFEYMAELQKKYTDNKVSTEIENYVKDLEVTKEELKALVKALDNLDFKVIYEDNIGLKPTYVAEFKKEIKWDIDLTSGYPYEFMKNYSFNPHGGFFSRGF